MFQELPAIVVSANPTMDAIISIFLTFTLALIITQVYKKTYKGSRYSQSFVHTVVIMSVVVSIIMIVIGNSIAAAFGLVGAFSIIRFRSAMSDPKDVAFIFFGMAVGISCGLGFYLLAIIFTFTLSILIFALYWVDYGKRDEVEKVLKLTIPENLHYENVFEEVFHKYLDYYSMESVETTNLGTMLQLQYTIKNKEGCTDKELIDAVRERNANLKVSISMAKSYY